MTTLSITLVRSADGSIDQDACLSAAKSAISKYVAERETELSTISDAVHSVFDSLKGAKANMPYVVNQATRALNAQPENFKSLTERVAQFVRDNAGTRESGKPFSISKGKGGGTARWSDLPEPESK